MVALCFAALFGALAGPAIATLFASPILLLTTPLFASLAALATGILLALNAGDSTAHNLQATEHESRPAVASTQFTASQYQPGADPVPDASDALANALVTKLQHILSDADALRARNSQSPSRRSHDHMRKSG